MDEGPAVASCTSSDTIECLLCNVPDQQFGSSCGDTVVNVLNWLNGADLTDFVCQNGIHRLFDSPCTV